MIEIIAPVGEVIERLERAISLNVSKSVTNKLTLKQFYVRPLPPSDIPRTSSGVDFRNDHSKIPKLLQECSEILRFDHVTNCTRMEANTQLPWHTNSDVEGFRIYYIKGKGIFKYIDEHGNQHLSHDNPEGWTCRKFKVVKDKPLWHSVYAEGTRYAFGFGHPL